MKTQHVPYMIFEENDLLLLRGACKIAQGHSVMTETQQGFKDMFDRINKKLIEIATIRQLRKSKLANDKQAVTALEYGLIAALIAVVIVGSITSLGISLNTTFSSVASSIGKAGK
jgi:pilus assembly protein Flp/PilA